MIRVSITISFKWQTHGDYDCAAGELHEPEEIGGVILPANEVPPSSLEPGKEAFDEPAALVAQQMAAILGLEFARGAMGRHQVHAVLLQVVIEPIALIGPIGDEMLRFGLGHVELETELDQGDFVMIRCVRTDGERKLVPIHNCANLHALPAFDDAHVVPATFDGRQSGVDEALALVNRSFFTQCIGQVSEALAQHLSLTLLLKSPMDSFVVGITLRQQVPLDPPIQNPEHRIQYHPGGMGF